MSEVNKTTPTKIIIDRAKWRCGGNSSADLQELMGSTWLLNSKGNMCCLGFCLAQTTTISIEGHLTPASAAMSRYKNGSNKIERHFLYVEIPAGVTNSHLSATAMTINDDAKLMPVEREKRLIDLFARENIELEFVGEYDSRVLELLVKKAQKADS